MQQFFVLSDLYVFSCGNDGADHESEVSFSVIGLSKKIFTFSGIPEFLVGWGLRKIDKKSNFSSFQMKLTANVRKICTSKDII